MFEVLVYLFENYYHAENAPDQGALTRRLSAAGFESEDIHNALDWLRGLAEENPEHVLDEEFDTHNSFRAYSDVERTKLSKANWGFLMFLESAGVVTPVLRELILERALALRDEPVPRDKFKVIVLMVLWTRQGDVDSLILEELLPDGEPRYVH